MQFYEPLVFSSKGDLPQYIVKEMQHLWVSAYFTAIDSRELSLSLTRQLMQRMSEFHLNSFELTGNRICRYCAAIQIPGSTCLMRVKTIKTRETKNVIRRICRVCNHPNLSLDGARSDFNKSISSIDQEKLASPSVALKPKRSLEAFESLSSYSSRDNPFDLGNLERQAKLNKKKRDKKGI